MTNTQQNFTPFNKEFCNLLEDRICHEMERSIDPDLKGFWCDGVSWFPSENQLTKKYVNDNRQIETKAWIGRTGQTEFKAIIKFGPKALSKYARGLDLTVTIPEFDSDFEWISIDIKNKTVEIKLN